jgi:predicted dehydrogenase
MTSLNFAIIGTADHLAESSSRLAKCQDCRSLPSATRIPPPSKPRAADGRLDLLDKLRRDRERDDVHAVIIATPNVAHKPIALAAIAHGKHVMCEKPLALTAKDAKEMADAAERAGVRHMTAFTYRFVPAMRYLGHLIKQGDLGQPYHYRPAGCRTGARGTSAGGK